MNNNAWQRGRRQAKFLTCIFMTYAHTVGMRLRETGVREKAIADILWHTRRGMTAHYSVAQMDELVEALNRITDERSPVNRSLAMIRRERLGKESPPKVPNERKTG